MIDSPEVAGDYYQKIADRIAVSTQYDLMIRCTYRYTGYRFRRKETCYQAFEVFLCRHER